MLRLCNAEIYKLRKSKSFYICITVTVAFVVLMYSMLAIMNSTMQTDSSMIVMINGEQNTGSIWDNIHIMDMLQEIFSGDVIACIIGIFTSIFVIREYGSGMMKNIVGKGCSRSSIYFAKLLAAILASLIISLTGIMATLAAGRIFIGAHAFGGDFWKNLPVYAALQLVMTCSLTGMYVWSGELCRNLAAGISIVIGISALPAMILHVIDMQFADQSITPSRYWLVTRMARCPFEGFTSGYVAETIAVSAFWLILTTAAGIWHFYRTDIK